MTKVVDGSTFPNILNNVRDESKACLSNIMDYLTSLEYPNLSTYPKSRLAAVLIILYEQNESLRVLLTTRSKELRTHAGQTALPGGKRDVSDADPIENALREAHEEISLPIDGRFLHILGPLEPFISQHKLLVTPVVAFLSNPEVIALLKPASGEVSHIFSHPLKGLLDPNLAKFEDLVPIGSENWPYENDFYCSTDVFWELIGTSYRMHRFRSSASPIKGLTADILIKVAEVAYAGLTVYERDAPQQVRNIKDIVDILQQADSIGVS